MRIAILLISILILAHSKAFSQTSSVELELNSKKISYFRKLEKEKGGKPYDPNITYLSSGNVATPEIYRRKEKALPDLLVSYSYYKKDSTLSTLEYQWDNAYDKKEKTMSLEVLEKNMISKYNQLLAQFTARYGKSTSDGSLDDLSELNVKSIYRTDTWAPNDTLKIQMYIAISKASDPAAARYHLRLYLYNLKEVKPETLSEKDEIMLEKQFHAFITCLSNDDLTGATALLADKIKATLTPAIFDQLKKIIHVDRRLEVYMKGIQAMPDGNTYPMLQFKYADDKTTPPGEYIIVIFDASNAILGLNPMKRQ
jgi:hypothetical protein